MKCLIDIKYSNAYNDEKTDTFVVQVKDLLDLKKKLRKLVDNDYNLYGNADIYCYDLLEIVNFIDDDLTEIECVPCLYKLDETCPDEVYEFRKIKC